MDSSYIPGKYRSTRQAANVIGAGVIPGGSLRRRGTELDAFERMRPEPRPGGHIYELPPDHHHCSRCGDIRPSSMFSPKADAANKLHPYCKACRNTAESKSYHQKRKKA
jgi:hypothetical protein